MTTNDNNVWKILMEIDTRVHCFCMQTYRNDSSRSLWINARVIKRYNVNVLKCSKTKVNWLQYFAYSSFVRPLFLPLPRVGSSSISWTIGYEKCSVFHSPTLPSGLLYSTSNVTVSCRERHGEKMINQAAFALRIVHVGGVLFTFTCSCIRYVPLSFDCSDRREARRFPDDP